MMANPRPIEEDKQHELMKDVDGEASCSKSQLPLGRNASSSSCLPSQLRLSDPLAVTVNPDPSASSHHSSSPGIVLHREQATSYLYDCFSGPIVRPGFSQNILDITHHASSSKDNHRKDSSLAKNHHTFYEKLEGIDHSKRKSSLLSSLHLDSCESQSTSAGTSKNCHSDYNSENLATMENRKRMSENHDSCHRQGLADIPFKKRLSNRPIDVGIVQNPVDVGVLTQGEDNLINIGIMENPVNIGILKNPNSVENLEGFGFDTIDKVCIEENNNGQSVCEEQVSKWAISRSNCYKPMKMKPPVMGTGGSTSVVKYLHDLGNPSSCKSNSIENLNIGAKHISIPCNWQMSADKQDRPGCSRYLDRQEDCNAPEILGSSSDLRKLGPPEQTGLSSMVKGDNAESMKVVEVDTSRGHNFHSDERPLAKPSSSNNTYNLKVCPSPITSESSYNFFQMAMYPEKVINIEEFLGVSDILITGNDDAGKKKKMSNIVPTIPTDNNSGSSCSNAIDPSGSSSLSSGVSMNLNSMVGPSTSGRFASVLNLSCYNENLDNYLKTGNNECMSSMNEASMASGAAGRNSENVVNLSQHVACPSGSSVTKVVVTSAVVDRPGSSNVVNPNGIIASTGVHHAAGSNHKAVVVNVPNLGAENGIRGVENGGQKIHNEQIPNQAENDLEMEFYESVIELENEYNGNNAREGRETNLSSSLPLSNGNNLDTSATTVANGGTALSGSPAAEGTNGMAGAATPTASDILKCTICTKTFKYESNLQSHLSAHKRRKCYKCKQCTKTFTFESDYNQHILTHHSGLTFFSCDYCQEQFSLVSELETHRVTHDSKRPYQCRYCEKNYTRKGDLKKHYRVHSGERPYQCEMCGKSFGASSDQLAKHLRIHLDEKPFSCNYCNKTFTHKANADKHMLFHVGEKLFKCTLCTKAFMQKCDLARHMRTHTGEKPHTCEYCGKAFSDQSAFSKHRRIHTGEGILKCSHCEKTFTNPYNRTRHMRLHTRERAFPCDLCDKIFTCNYSVKMHRRIHTGEKPHKCDYCFKTFTSSSNLNKHLKTHHPVKAVKYECCGTMYADPAALDEHFKSHGAKQS